MGIRRGSVVAVQLVERSLPTPEIRGSNPVIGKFYLLSAVLKNCVEKTKKTPGMARFLKKTIGIRRSMIDKIQNDQTKK